MSKADLAARAARIKAGKPAPVETPGEEPAPLPPSTPVRTKPVRVTTDLDPNLYRSLKTFTGDLGTRLDRPQLAHQAVTRALIAELADDPDLRERVSSRVRQQFSK